MDYTVNVAGGAPAGETDLEGLVNGGGGGGGSDGSGGDRSEGGGTTGVGAAAAAYSAAAAAAALRAHGVAVERALAGAYTRSLQSLT
jgi:hypothetical protein